RETERIRTNLELKYKLFSGNKKPADLNNKIVIVVDDGAATGSTIKATVHSIRKSKPKKIIIAVPVSAPTAAKELRLIADEFICLHTPADFFGVGQFYEDFSQVSDEEVISLLCKANLVGQAI
ncbi:MAG TPA: phosphoribosyltransferase family protein, partial [Bacteroidia bacterium]